MGSTRTARSLRAAVGAALAVLALAAVSAPAAPTAPFLGGTWVNQADTSSEFFVSQNYYRHKIYIRWNGNGTHSGLRGTLDGTLDGFGKAYNGTFHVEEGSTVVDGTSRVVISSVSFHGVPLLRVKLTPNSGTPSSFTLEILFPALEPPKVGPTAPVNVDVNCDGSKPCPGSIAGDAAATPGAADTGGAAATGSKPVQVAYRAFDLSARGGKDFKVRLNQTGQNLLAKRGSLKVKIIVKFNKSAGLPTKTALGTVTFHMH